MKLSKKLSLSQQVLEKRMKFEMKKFAVEFLHMDLMDLSIQSRRPLILAKTAGLFAAAH
jgi:hypothetical protein